MRTIVLIAAVVSFGTGCAHYPSVSQVSESWIGLKTSIGSSNTEAQIETQIDDFKDKLNGLLSSPVVFVYQVHMPGNMQFLKDLPSVLDGLKAAVHNGDGETVISIVFEIDRTIEQLWQTESGLSKKSQLDYFQLFFFFSMLVITSIFLTWGMFNRLEKAKSRERQSLAFSRETVMAQEQERERIARELHDTVAQDLWRLSFQVDGIDRAQDPQERSRLCAEVVSGQKEIMGRVRSICNALVPPDFKHRGFGDALRSLCHEFQQRSGIECQVTLQEALPLHDMDIDVQLQCFRIVQECLTNIEKYSEATEASVLVYTKEKDTLTVCVSDNGRGFSAPDWDSCEALREKGHFGLWNMYERASSMAGKLYIESEERDAGPALGTLVTLQIPLTGSGT